METMITLSPNVQMTKSEIFVILIDGEHIGYSFYKNEALDIAEQFAKTESKNLESPNVKVFRTDERDGEKIVLSTQALGYIYNGSPREEIVVEIKSVKGLKIINGSSTEESYSSSEESDSHTIITRVEESTTEESVDSNEYDKTQSVSEEETVHPTSPCESGE